LLASGNCQVIAIEGNQEFLPYLKRNLGAYAGRSTIIPNYVGLPGVAPRAAITSSGTASLKVGIGSAVKLRSVSSIVSELALDKIELIKIDTDGFDIEILLSSIDWLSVAKPILFFEFYPKLFSEVTKDGWCIFGALESIGYIGAIIYLNTGAYLRSLRPKDAVQVEELRALLCSIDDNSYVDILAFADEEKFSKFNGNELQYFCAVGKT
jgi:FkbM family methyltransferase